MKECIKYSCYASEGLFTVKAVIGINPGYFHKNSIMAANFGSVVQDICEEVFNETGIYISLVISHSTVIYRKEWGCPDGGEITYTVETSPDPKYYHGFGESSIKTDEYVKTACIVIQRIAKRYEQSSVKILIVPDVTIKKYEYTYEK